MLRRTPVLLLTLLLTACSAPLQPQTVADRTTAPKLGSCYALTPADTAKSSDASEPVSCSTPHTSQTFAVGTLPESTGKDYAAAGHGRWIFPTCERAFEKLSGSTRAWPCGSS